MRMLHDTNNTFFFFQLATQKHILKQACLTFYEVRETSVKFGLHADNMKFDAQNEEWINVRIIISTNIPMYFSVHRVL